MLEARLHQSSFFCTLTYDQVHVPGDGGVRPRDVQLFLKRLREACAEKIRFFAVGEYGDRTQRPHYHLVLFGLLDYRLIGSCWPFGAVHVGFVTPQSCAYVSGYTVKKWTKVVPELNGRHPEFTRMSLRPGIGAVAAEEIGRAYVSRSGAAALARDGDVASAVRIDGRLYPLGRYLRGLARLAVGAAVTEPEAVSSRRYQELRQKLYFWSDRARREVELEQRGRSAEWRKGFILSRKGVM